MTARTTSRSVPSLISSADRQNVDLTKIHNLSGPIAVEGAKTGDVLIVDILDVTPFPDMQWGYTGIFESTFLCCGRPH